MGPNQRIFGIGKDERQAIQRARDKIGADRFTPIMFECMPCTAELYRSFHQNGTAVLSWERDEFGVARLAAGDS